MTGSSTEYKYRGIVPRAVAQVYHEIADRFDQAITIRISYVEIYNEMVRTITRVMIFRCSISCHRFPLMNRVRLISKLRRTRKAGWLLRMRGWSCVTLRKRRLIASLKVNSLEL